MEFISDITITQKAYSIISINIIPPTLLNWQEGTLELILVYIIKTASAVPGVNLYIMEWKLYKQWWSTIPPISINPP